MNVYASCSWSQKRSLKNFTLLLISTTRHLTSSPLPKAQRHDYHSIELQGRTSGIHLDDAITINNEEYENSYELASINGITTFVKVCVRLVFKMEFRLSNIIHYSRDNSRFSSYMNSSYLINHLSVSKKQWRVQISGKMECNVPPSWKCTEVSLVNL